MFHIPVPLFRSHRHKGCLSSNPFAASVKHFFTKSPIGSTSSVVKPSFFGSAKPPGYSVENEDYFLGAAGRAAVTSTHKTPMKTRALMKALVLGGKVRFLFVEAGTSCGGPVGTFKGKVCMKERQACSIAKHRTQIEGFVSGYYLQPTNNTTTVYSTPFIPTSVAENNEVLLAQLDR